MTNGMTPEEAIVATEIMFRTYVVMKLQSIGMTCLANCETERKYRRTMGSIGAMLLQALITGAFAVVLALITLHFKG